MQCVSLCASESAREREGPDTITETIGWMIPSFPAHDHRGMEANGCAKAY